MPMPSRIGGSSSTPDWLRAGRVMVPKGKRVNGMPWAHSGHCSAGQARLGTVLAA